MVKKCLLCKSPLHLFASCALFLGLQEELAANVGITPVQQGDAFGWVDRFGHFSATLSELASLDWLLAENVKFWSAKRIGNFELDPSTPTPPVVQRVAAPPSCNVLPEFFARKAGPELDRTAEEPSHFTDDHFSEPSVILPSVPTFQNFDSAPIFDNSEINFSSQTPDPLDLDDGDLEFETTESSDSDVDETSLSCPLFAPVVGSLPDPSLLGASVIFPGAPKTFFDVAVLDPKLECSFLCKRIATKLTNKRLRDRVKFSVLSCDLRENRESDGYWVTSDTFVTLPITVNLEFESRYCGSQDIEDARFLVRRERDYGRPDIVIGSNILKFLKLD